MAKKDSEALDKNKREKDLDLGNLDNFDNNEDNFDFDMDLESDSTKSRSPIAKVKNEISKGIRNTASNTAETIKDRVSERMPNAASMINDFESFKNDVEYLRDDFVRDITPTIQQLKRTGQQLKPHIQGFLPPFAKKFYDKIIRTEDTEETTKSKEEKEKESIAQEIDSVLGKQFKTTLELEKERKQDNLIDRAIEDNRHKQDFKQFSVIRGASEFQVNFMRDAQLPYMKKSLELKLRHLYIAKETRDRIKSVSEILEGKLDQIRHNTALPDIQKVQRAETLKAKVRDRVNDKILGIGGKILGNVKDKVLDPFKNTLGQLAGMGDMAGMFLGGKGSPLNTLLSLGYMFGGEYLGGKITKKLFGDRYSNDNKGIFGNRADFVEEMLENSREKLLLSMNDKAKLGGDGILGKILSFLDQGIENNVGSAVNIAARDPNEVTSFKNKDSIALTQVIPGLLSKQLQQLTILTTGKRNTEELVFDYDSQTFVTSSKKLEQIRIKAFGSQESRQRDYAEAQARVQATFDQKFTGDKDSLKMVNDAMPLISKVIVNAGTLGRSLQPDIIHKKAEEIRKLNAGLIDEFEIPFNSEVDDYFNDLFKGLPKDKKVDGKGGDYDSLILALDTMLYTNGKLNTEIFNQVYNEIVLYFKKTDRYKEELQRAVDQGYAGLMQGKGGLIESSGSSFTFSDKNVISEFTGYGTGGKVGDKEFSAIYLDEYSKRQKHILERDAKIREEIEGDHGTVGNLINQGVNKGYEFIQNAPDLTNKFIEDISNSITNKIENATSRFVPKWVKNVAADKKKKKKEEEKRKKDEEKKLKDETEREKKAIERELNDEVSEALGEEEEYTGGLLSLQGGTTNINIPKGIIKVLKRINRGIDSLPDRLTKVVLPVRIVNFEDFGKGGVIEPISPIPEPPVEPDIEPVLDSSIGNVTDRVPQDLGSGLSEEEWERTLSKRLEEDEKARNVTDRALYDKELTDEELREYVAEKRREEAEKRKNNPFVSFLGDALGGNINFKEGLSFLSNTLTGGLFGTAAKLGNLGIDATRNGLEKAGLFTPEGVKPIVNRLEILGDKLDSITQILQGGLKVAGISRDELDEGELDTSPDLDENGKPIRRKKKLLKRLGLKTKRLFRNLKSKIDDKEGLTNKLKGLVPGDGLLNKLGRGGIGAAGLLGKYYKTMLKAEWWLTKKAFSGGVKGLGFMKDLLLGKKQEDDSEVQVDEGEGILAKSKRGFLNLFNKASDKAKEYIFVDIYRKDEVDPEHPLLTAAKQQEGVYFSDGKKVKSSYLIDRPVMSSDMMATLISEEDIKTGLVDVNNKPLNKGKMLLEGATGLMDKFKDIKGLQGGLLGKLGGLLGKGAGLFKGDGLIGKSLGMYLDMYGKVVTGTLSAGKDLIGGIFGGGMRKVKPITTRLDAIIAILNKKFEYDIQPDTTGEDKELETSPKNIFKNLGEKLGKFTPKGIRSRWDSFRSKYFNNEDTENVDTVGDTSDGDKGVDDIMVGKRDKQLALPPGQDSKNPLADRKRREQAKAEKEEVSDRRSLVDSLKGIKDGLVGGKKKKGIFGKLLAGLGLLLAPLKGIWSLAKGIYQVGKGAFWVGKNIFKGIGFIGGLIGKLTKGLFGVLGKVIPGAGALLGGLSKGKKPGVKPKKIGKGKVAAMSALAAYLGYKVFSSDDKKEGLDPSKYAGDIGDDNQMYDPSAMEDESQEVNVNQQGIEDNEAGISDIAKDLAVDTALTAGAGHLASKGMDMYKKSRPVSQMTIDTTAREVTNKQVVSAVNRSAAKQGFKTAATQVAKTVLTKVASSALVRGAAMILGGPVGLALTAGSIVLPMLADTSIGKKVTRFFGFGGKDDIKFRMDLYGIDGNADVSVVEELENKTKSSIEANVSLSDKDINYFIEEFLDVKGAGLSVNSYIALKKQFTAFKNHGKLKKLNPLIVKRILAYEYFNAWYKNRFLIAFGSLNNYLEQNNLSIEQLPDLDDDVKKGLYSFIGDIKNSVISQYGDVQLTKDIYKKLVEDAYSDKQETEEVKVDSNLQEVAENIKTTWNSDIQDNGRLVVKGNRNDGQPSNIIQHKPIDSIEEANRILKNSIFNKKAGAVPLGVNGEDSVKDRALLYGFEINGNRGIFGHDLTKLMLNLEYLTNKCIDSGDTISDTELVNYACKALLNSVPSHTKSKERNEATTYFTVWYKRRFIPIFVAFKNISERNGLKIDQVDDASPELKNKIIRELAQRVQTVISKTSELICSNKSYLSFSEDVARAKKELETHGDREAIQRYQEDYGSNANKKNTGVSVAENEAIRKKTVDAEIPNASSGADPNQSETYRNMMSGADSQASDPTKSNAYRRLMGLPENPEDDPFREKKLEGAAALQRLMGGQPSNTQQGNTPGSSSTIDTKNINVPSIPKSSGKGSDLGNYVHKFESGPKGPLAIAWDRTGGTSYGTYQVAAIPGSAKNFVNYAGQHGGEFGKQFAKAMWDANSQLQGGGGKNGLETGGTKGATVDVWKTFASKDKKGFNQIERDFIRTDHYEPAYKGLPPSIREAIDNDRGLQEALWSTAIQHGPGGARKIFNRAWKESGGQGGDAFIKAIYNVRGTQFPSSTPNVQASVRNRFKEEVGIILGLSKQHKPLGADGSSPEGNNQGDTSQSTDTSTSNVSDNAAKTGNEGNTGNSMANLNNVDPATNPGGAPSSSAPEVSSNAPSINSGSTSVSDGGDQAVKSDSTTAMNAAQDTAGNSSTPNVPGANAQKPSGGPADKSAIKIQGGVDYDNLHPVLKERFGNMAKEFKEKHKTNLTVTSGKRSMAKQQALYDKLGPGQAARPNPLAPHISGLALDADGSQMNTADKDGLLKKYGLWRPLWPKGLGKTKPENWHVEPVGSRDPKSGMRITQGTLNAMNSQGGGVQPAPEAGSDQDTSKKVAESGDQTQATINNTTGSKKPTPEMQADAAISAQQNGNQPSPEGQAALAKMDGNQSKGNLRLPGTLGNIANVASKGIQAVSSVAGKIKGLFGGKDDNTAPAVTDTNTMNAAATVATNPPKEETSTPNVPAVQAETKPAAVQPEVIEPKPVEQQPQFDTAIFTSIDGGIKQINGTLLEMLKVQQMLAEVLSKNNSGNTQQQSNDEQSPSQQVASKSNAPITMSRARAA